MDQNTYYQLRALAGWLAFALVGGALSTLL